MEKLVYQKEPSGQSPMRGLKVKGLRAEPLLPNRFTLLLCRILQKKVEDVNNRDIRIRGNKNNLQKLEKKTGKLRPYMAEMANTLLNEVADAFDGEKSVQAAWAPLKVISYHLGYSIGLGRKTHTKKGQQTVAFQKYTQNKIILRQTGHLADYWETEATDSEAGIFNPVKNKGFAYGIVHQTGSQKRNIPRRAFLPIEENGELTP